jgi:hypothetical protein
MDGIDRWVEVKRYARQSDAEADALALVALGIGSRIVEREVGLALVVAGPDALRADHELAEYHRENQMPAPMALRPSHEGLVPALAYAAILILVHGAASRDLFGLDWWTAGYAQAGLTVGGEWWRTVTSLTLHADLGHLAGNVLAGSLFGVALAQFLGPGLAWLSVLIPGCFDRRVCCLGLNLGSVLEAEGCPHRPWHARLATFGCRTGPARGPRHRWRTHRCGSACVWVHRRRRIRGWAFISRC